MFIGADGIVDGIALSRDGRGHRRRPVVAGVRDLRLPFAAYIK
jgi:hypothetical protein